ncbi:MAG: RNA polymerase sigma factor [Pyrinomonadaceae bacterium]
MCTGEITSAAGLDFEDLARRLLTQDAEALEIFSELFGRRMRNYFIWQGLNYADAEELSASCVYKIISKIDHYKPQKSGFAAWVYTVARNAHIDWLRKRKREAQLPGDYDAPDEAEKLDPEDARALCDAVMQLSEKDKQLIALLYVRDQKYEEVRAALGIKAEAARTRNFRVLKRLEAILKKDPRVDIEALRGRWRGQR